MIAPPSAVRTQPDRCPGLLAPHRAVDGALIRLRLPGGVITADALSAVSEASQMFGDGQIQLTSRGNLQLRGVATGANGAVPDDLIDRISAAGLLPSAAHELVRNITCSPLTGRVGGIADLRRLTVDLDHLLCESGELARLPGRFLFGLDDGRGDIASLEIDLGVRAISTHRVELSIGGLRGPVIELDEAAAALVALAAGFVRSRGNGPGALWHVAELPTGGMGLLADLGLDRRVDTVHPRPGPSVRSAEAATPPDSTTGYGIFPQDDGASLLSVVVPLGVLTAAQVAAAVSAARQGGGEVIVTPWRGVLIPDLRPDADLDTIGDLFTDVGLSLDPGSGWGRVSACTGSPGCDNGHGPTRALATRCVQSGSPADALPVHVVACERRCGSPAADHVEILVQSDSLVVSRPSRQLIQSLPLTGTSTTVALADAVARAMAGR